MAPRKKVREPDPVCEPTERDYFMARMAACRASLAAALELADEIIGFTIDPDDDKSGNQRDEALDAAEEAISAAALSLQEATRVWADDDSEVDPTEGEEYPEPEEDDEDEDEDVDDDEEVD